MFDLTTRQGRQQAVEHIESHQNKGRKSTAFEASEIYSDRIRQYVIDELREQFTERTVREMPIVSSVNICKRIVNQLACIYQDAPNRQWTELSEDQTETVKLVYDDMMANKKLSLANRLYKNHGQCLIQIIPKKGKLCMRVLKPFQYDAIPMDDDPEQAKAIIISSFDKSEYLDEAADDPVAATGVETTYKQSSDNYKETRALKERMAQSKKVYAVYTDELMFKMDEAGNIIGDEMPNPIGMMPFIEVSKEKEFEYWVRDENAYAQFTKTFNAAMSSVQQVVKMQGFAVGVLKGPQELLMETITVGPNIVLKLPVDANAGIDTDFSYVNPGSDINGSIQYLEVLLTTFLSSNGIDPKTVTMSGEGQTYNSGIERLLSMIEKVSASREDFDIFHKIEKKVWRVVKAWLTALNDASNLDDRYKAGVINEESDVEADFARPELVKSEAEELDVIEREIALGLSSPINAIMQREGLSREDAEEKYDLYQRDLIGTRPTERREN